MHQNWFNWLYYSLLQSLASLRESEEERKGFMSLVKLKALSDQGQFDKEVEIFNKRKEDEISDCR